MKEFSGMLREYDNYNNFKKTIIAINKRFREIFGDELIDKYDIFIDNALTGSGYTPTCVVILDKYILIKLHIEDFSDTTRIRYQYSHELTHYIFRALNGLEDKKRLVEEEHLASAMSLVMLKEFNDPNFESYSRYVENLEEEKYRKGIDVARSIDFDVYELKKLIFNLY